MTRVTVAIDVECTGGIVGKDKCFAVGIAVGRRVAAQQVAVLEKHLLVESLYKPAGESWAEFWFTGPFENRCFTEFWSQHIDALERLEAAANTTCIADSLNDTLKTIELTYGNNVEYVFDCPNFAPTWINFLLSNIHRPSLLYFRDGTYGVHSFDCDSYIAGFLRAQRSGELSWDTDVKPYRAMLRASIPSTVVHDNRPDNDAEELLHMFLGIGGLSQRNFACFMCGQAYGERGSTEHPTTTVAKCGHKGTGWFCHSDVCNMVSYTDKRCGINPASNACKACCK